MRNHVPLATCAIHVEQGVHDFTQYAILTRSSICLFCFDKWALSVVSLPEHLMGNASSVFQERTQPLRLRM